MIGIDDAVVAVGFAAKARAFLKRVPSWVYAILAVAALLGLGAYLHHRAVKSAYDTAFKAGEAAEAARVEAAATKLATKAAAITAKIRSKTDETIRHISADADDLRLRGPGKASCSPATTPSASGHIAPGGSAAAAVDQVPDRERLGFIALPFSAAIAGAEQADANRAEVIAWRTQHDQLTAQSVKP